MEANGMFAVIRVDVLAPHVLQTLRHSQNSSSKSHLITTIIIKNISLSIFVQVAYEYVIACQEIASIERSLGAYYFSNGGFDDEEQRRWFTTQVNIFDSKYGTAREASDIVPPFSKSAIIVDHQDLGMTIQRFVIIVDF